MKTLYHPNALPAHIREKLPDPNRPIDTPVVPATVALFHDTFDPIYQELAENFNPKSSVKTNPFPKTTTVENILTFLKNQQIQGESQSLTLADFVKNVRPLGQVLIETVVNNHPDFYPNTGYLNTGENRLFITAQFWQNLLALWLIAQCPTRKTLNHDLTLQTLSEQINVYLSQHQREVEFLTHHSKLNITPDNVAFAILALDGKISKKGTLGERVTNISANNFLTNFQSP